MDTREITLTFLWRCAVKWCKLPILSWAWFFRCLFVCLFLCVFCLFGLLHFYCNAFFTFISPGLAWFFPFMICFFVHECFWFSVFEHTLNVLCVAYRVHTLNVLCGVCGVQSTYIDFFMCGVGTTCTECFVCGVCGVQSTQTEFCVCGVRSKKLHIHNKFTLY